MSADWCPGGEFLPEDAALYAISRVLSESLSVGDHEGQEWMGLARAVFAELESLAADQVGEPE